MRNPRRTSSTAAALMIGVALVTLASVFFTSAKVSIADQVTRAFHGDFILESQDQTGMSGVPVAVGETLQKRSEFAAVVRSRDITGKIEGKSETLSAVDSNFNDVLDLDVQEGNFATMKRGEVAISRKVADDKKLKIGSVIQGSTGTAEQSPLRVVVIFKDTGPLYPYVVPLSSATGPGVSKFDFFVFVKKAEGTSDAGARKVLEDIVAPYVTVKVQDQTELVKEFTEQINNALYIFYALLGLAVLIALLGIANTLALSVFERTRELGLMRAIGMTRRQVRSMVRWEAVIVSLLGTILGLVIGISFGWALVTATKDEGINILAVPWGTVAAIIVIAAVAGIVAAILPARRAARFKILTAIASE